MSSVIEQTRLRLAFRVSAVVLLLLSLRNLAGTDHLEAVAHIAATTVIVLFAFDAESRKGGLLLILVAIGLSVADFARYLI